jgi:hypothetical protein
VLQSVNTLSEQNNYGRKVSQKNRKNVVSKLLIAYINNFMSHKTHFYNLGYINNTELYVLTTWIKEYFTRLHGLLCDTCHSVSYLISFDMGMTCSRFKQCKCKKRINDTCWWPGGGGVKRMFCLANSPAATVSDWTEVKRLTSVQEWEWWNPAQFPFTSVC